ncbi:MAG: hypothetical protein JSV47_06525 [Deltaproteobacteria bacterium]|nr:MAG: hypothetical protein JSV47_06525 [Deltaproteobacteria bacterium]
MKQDNGIFYDNICFVPVIHGRLEFAMAVIRWFAKWQPDAVVVEYPKTLQDVMLRGLNRLPLLSVVLYQEKDGTHVYLPLEPTDGVVEAARLALAHDLPLHFVDRDLEGMPQIYEPLPDPYAIHRIGHTAYCQTYADQSSDQESSREDLLREANMAYHLQQLSKNYKRLLFVCGISHYPSIQARLSSTQAQPIGRQHRDGVMLAHLHERSSKEIMSEIPYLAAAYEKQRHELLTLWQDQPEAVAPLDRLQLHENLIQEAGRQHLRNSQDEVTPQQYAVLRRFARNYALIQGFLAPDFYQLVVAARGAVDDNYSYEVWDLGSRYPWQEENPGLPAIELRGEDLFLNQRKIRFHRRFRTTRRRLVPVPGKKGRLQESRPGEWQRQWEGHMICSHPPEDLVIEGWGHYIKKKAGQILAAENTRTVPFTSSLMDGIDLRETIRNWHEGKLYVKENRPLQGKVGSVVLIFDEDLADDENKRERFPWRVTWLGEHEQESDMAFYSTPSGQHLVGPGISRCQYGGFMLTYPPMRVYDIWQDPYFEVARTKPERLLLAAIDYCEESQIAYIAAKPPRSWCHSVASRYRKKIIYLPLGIFSPVFLKKIRTFHVLDGHHVRKYANEYI